MKKLYFTFLVSILLLVSCNKKYTYIETVVEHDIFDRTSINTKEAKKIYAKNDSIAYMKAYETFCISIRVYEHMKEKGASYVDAPIDFNLYDNKGRDISEIQFMTKETGENETFSRIMGLKLGNSDNECEISKNNIDSVKIKELLPFFDVEKDEFDPRGIIWYTPKSFPKYNGISLYFSVQDGKLNPLRIKIQYYGEDWLFVNKIQFSIDNNAYEYKPYKIERENEGGDVWEWSDESLKQSDKELITALVNAKNAKIKYVGKHYHSVRTIKPNQIEDIKRSLELYKAMGGIY